MKIQDLYNDYNIPNQTEGHKHCHPGWVHTPCPFCTGNPGLHLGFNKTKNYFKCWRCGFHHIDKVLIALLHVSQREAKELIRQYGGQSFSEASTIKPQGKGFKFPSNCKQMEKQHWAYLENRNFDPDKLEQIWGLTGTGPVSFLDKKDYKHRIIIPIRWGGDIVSFQGRDITNRAKLRYKACPLDRESIPHQTILYGLQEKWGNIGICVEGVTDVWRLGFSAFCTFGISFTPPQIRSIVKYFKQVVILFDDDPQAQVQADKLKAELKFRGVKTRKEIIEGDPASLTQNDAAKLVKEITQRIY